MATAPYGVRLLVGVATIAVEETLRLPRTILMYPMTLVSQAAQVVMAVQQGIAELAIKGDSTLETIFPPKDEQPPWATFDEDLPDSGPRSGFSPAAGGTTDDHRNAGRFALYSGPDGSAAATDAGRAAPSTPAAAVSDGPAVTVPSVATELDYASLTLAQLRSRVQTLDVADLESLLHYEQATKARAPFQTLLANRITRATAK